jgi:hypothetical protein
MMSQSANVQSVEAIREFRAALSEFCKDVLEALTSVELESRRLEEWLTHEQPVYWRRQLLERQDEVQHAKSALFRKQLVTISGRQPDVIEEKKALRKAHERVEEAEEKIERCRKWSREVRQAIDEFSGPANQLAGFVDGKPPPCMLDLDEIICRLDAYTAIHQSGARI